MDQKVNRVLREYEARAAREHGEMEKLTREQIMERVDEFLISVGPDAGNFLNILIKATQSQNILELGTSYGYSTVFLAEAARATAGRVVTVDISEKKHLYARERIGAADLEAYVEFRAGDATQVISTLPGEFDFVLIDLWKELYIPCFDAVYPKLATCGLVAADNIIHPEATRPHMLAYREHLRQHADMQSVLLPVGNGIELSLRSG
jgi:predicted O-methyltransferase YrrM